VRRFSSSAGIAALFLAVALWPASAATGQDYEVRFHRPAKVGDKEHLAASGHVVSRLSLKAGDKVIQAEAHDYTVECEGAATILEVDQKDEPAKFSLLVEKCTRTEAPAAAAGKPATEKAVASELVPKGAVVVLASKGEETTVEVNGRPAAPEVQEALSEVFRISANAPTDDELFGTKERRKVGDQWAGNAELMSADLAKRGFVLKNAKVSSTITLEKVVKVGETDCLQVRGQFEGSGVEPSGLPPNLKIEQSAIRARFGGKFPVDTKAMVPERWAEFEGTLVGAFTAPNAPEARLEIFKSVSNVMRESAAK